MRAAVFYATREGQSQRVAERVALGLRGRGVNSDVINVKDRHAAVDWDAYGRAFLVASVHAGHHEREMIDFVTHSKDCLTRLGASFLSLTLSQAGAEDGTATPERRAAAHADAERMIAQLVADTGWQPARTLTVAGALTYSKYNFFKKLIMKRIARKAGFTGDTARDYEFTNWPEIDRFVSNASLSPHQPSGDAALHQFDKGEVRSRGGCQESKVWKRRHREPQQRAERRGRHS